MKNYSEITASAQTDFDYPAGFVNSVVTSDFSHFITKSPAIYRGLESGNVKNPILDFRIGFLGFSHKIQRIYNGSLV
jgi:hypothetical protein